MSPRPQESPPAVGMSGISGFGASFAREASPRPLDGDLFDPAGTHLSGLINRIVQDQQGKPTSNPTEDAIAYTAGSGGRQLQTSLADLLNQLDPAQDFFLDRDSLSATPIVLEGGEVNAFDPPEMKVEVLPLSGLYQNKEFNIERPVTLTVNDDGTTQLWVISVDEGGMVRLRQVWFPDEFPIAKIVIPEPGTTARIVQSLDDRDGPDGWIMHNTDPTFFNDYRGDDQNITSLANTILEVPGELVTGRLTASENFRIGNALETVIIDSREIQFFDENKVRLARLGANGLIFYDGNGVVISRYDANQARIGNLVIDTNGIHSEDYIARQQGLALTADGNLDAEDVRIRGQIYLRRSSTGTLFGYVNRLHNVSNIVVSDGESIQFNELSDDQTGVILEPFDKRPIVTLSRYGVRVVEQDFFTPVVQDAVSTASSDMNRPYGEVRDDGVIAVAAGDGASIDDEDSYWLTFGTFFDPDVDQQDPTDPTHIIGKPGSCTKVGTAENNVWVRIRIALTTPEILDRFGDPVECSARVRFWRGFVDETVPAIHTSWPYQTYYADFKYFCDGKTYKFSHLFTNYVAPIEPSGIYLWGDGKVDLLSITDLTVPLNGEDTTPTVSIDEITHIRLNNFASRQNQVVTARMLSQNYYY